GDVGEHPARLRAPVVEVLQSGEGGVEDVPPGGAAQGRDEGDSFVAGVDGGSLGRATLVRLSNLTHPRRPSLSSIIGGDVAGPHHHCIDLAWSFRLVGKAVTEPYPHPRFPLPPPRVLGRGAMRRLPGGPCG